MKKLSPNWQFFTTIWKYCPIFLESEYTPAIAFSKITGMKRVFSGFALLIKGPDPATDYFITGCGDAVGLVSADRIGGEAWAGTDDYNPPPRMGDTGVVQVVLIEKTHDAIAVTEPKKLGPVSIIKFELSISHDGDNPSGKIWMSTNTSRTFAGLNFVVIPTEGGAPMSEGNPLGYADYIGNSIMATGVGVFAWTSRANQF